MKLYKLMSILKLYWVSTQTVKTFRLFDMFFRCCVYHQMTNFHCGNQISIGLRSSESFIQFFTISLLLIVKSISCHTAIARNSGEYSDMQALTFKRHIWKILERTCIFQQRGLSNKLHQNKTLFNVQLLRSIASSLSHPSSSYHRHYTNELSRHRHRGIVIAPSTLTSMVR